MLINKIYNSNKNTKFKCTPTIPYKYDVLPRKFRFPHINSKYFKNIVDLNEDIVIPLYITDYHQKEYLYDLHSEKFTLCYQINDNDIVTINNICAGDYNLIIPGISVENNYTISLYVIDRFGVSSPTLYKKVWVRNQSDYVITESQTYTITKNDLDKYGIKNNNSADITDLDNTLNGLTSLFQEIKDNGYKKAILLNGIYRIPYNDRVNPILIPSNFTLDMNGSTFKQNPPTLEEYNADKGSLICQMRNCFDSHIMNGILDGDYVERLVVNEELGKDLITGSKGEQVWAFNFYGTCEYCTFENMTVNNITCYALSAKHSGSSYFHMTLNPSVNESIPWLTNSSIDINTGNVESLSGFCLSDYYDISNVIKYGYMVFGVFLGSGGIVGGKSWKYIAFWYDKDKNYIGYNNACQYRKLKFPPNAYYVRINIVADEFTPSYHSHMIYYFEYNTNCAYKNITANNCRSCVFNPDYYKDLLIENANIADSGQSITPAPIDFEDGWQNGQDCYMKNLSATKNNAGSDTIILCSGFNYIFDNVNMGYAIRSGVYGTTICNSTLNNISRFDFDSSNVSWEKNGYLRIMNNKFIGFGLHIGKTIDSDCPRIIKKCTLIETTTGIGTFKYCNIKDSKNYSDPNFVKCALNNFNIVSASQPKFNDCYIISPSSTCRSGEFNRCRMENGIFKADIGILLDSCILKNVKITKDSWEKPKRIKIINCNISTSGNLVKVSVLDSSIEFNISNNNISIIEGNLVNFSHFFSGNIIVNNNKINLDDGYYLITTTHGVDNATNIVMKNNIYTGNDILESIKNDSRVTIVYQ